jgi:hypothetical protein
MPGPHMKLKEEKVPFHTRLGLRLLQLLLVIFALLLIRRCVVIYHDNKLTGEQIKVEYFEKGYHNGLKKAQKLPENQQPQFKNYILKKAYRDGYRKGWDAGRDLLKQKKDN